MRGVGRDQQDGLAVLGHLDRERTGGRRLADATFAADEDPSQAALVDEVLEGGREGVVVAVDDGGGHGCGGDRVVVGREDQVVW